MNIDEVIAKYMLIMVGAVNGVPIDEDLPSFKSELLRTIQEALPDKKTDDTARALRAGEYSRGDYERTQGYNQAIDDMEANLKKALK